MALALVLAACTGGAGGGAGDGDGGAGDGDGGAGGASAAGAGPTVRVALCRPGTLLPGDNLEVCGTELLTQVFTPLVRYDHETGAAVPAAATSVTSADQRVWRIELAAGGRFHDGEAVTARSFADAWDLVVARGLTTASYLDRIEGWGAVADGTADHLAGVDVVDDLTLEVSLTRPFAQFPLLLGFNPYLPLPRAVLDDPSGGTSTVVGNGPWRIADRDADRIVVEAVADHPEGPAAVPRVEYVVVADEAEGLAALRAGRVDVAAVPAAADLAELEDGLVISDGVALQYLSFPLATAPYDDLRVRRALSLAIDRQALARDVLAGAARPATGLIPPAAPGSTDVACDVCRHDPAAARALWDAAGATGPITLGGRGGDGVPEAIAAQWSAALDVEVVVDGHRVDGLADPDAAGPVLTTWFLDYLSPQNVLDPLFATGGAANHNGFSSADVDAVVAAAGAAEGFEASVEAYRRAESLVLAQLPAAPAVFDRRLVVHGDAVETVVLDRLGQVVLADLVPS